MPAIIGTFELLFGRRRTSIHLGCLLLLILSHSAWAGTPPSFLLEWGSHGVGQGQFESVGWVAVDAFGNVYTTDDGTIVTSHRVQVFTNTGDYLAEWGSYGTGDGQFEYPEGVAVGPNGDVYVTDLSPRVQRFTTQGVFVQKWGTSGLGDGEFGQLQGIAIAADGSVYVADSGNHRIQEFTEDGTFVRKWGANGGDGSLGSGPGEFYSPEGIAVDALGNVFVSDLYDRVQKFTSEGVYVTQWGGSGSSEGEFQAPQGVAVDVAGNIYVAEFLNNRVQVFTNNGGFLATWGVFGSGEGQFNIPKGVALDSDGEIFVADSGNYRVQKFGYDPSSISTHSWGDIKALYK